MYQKAGSAFLQACGQKAALEADAAQQQLAIDAQEAVIAEIQARLGIAASLPAL